MFTTGQKGYLEKLIPFKVNVRDYKRIMSRYRALSLTYVDDKRNQIISM